MIKSWMLASPKIKFLRALSLGVGFFVFSICFALYLKSDSTDQMHLREIEVRAENSDISFSQHGPRVYEFFADKDRGLASCLLIFLIGNWGEGLKWSGLFRRKLISQTIAFISLGITAYGLLGVLFWKYKLSETNSWATPLYSLLRSSVSFDWVCLVLIFGLFVIQLFEYFQNSSIKNKLEFNPYLTNLRYKEKIRK